MRDINEILPKLPEKTWGGVFNYKPTPSEIDLLRTKPPFGYDSKWHTILRHGDSVHIDGKEIRIRSAESMT